MNEIIIGTSYTEKVTITENMLACNVGSGDVNVYATPMMLALMERAAANCLKEFLDDEMTSVGTEISASHLAATPLLMQVSATAVITGVESNGRKISFDITASDESGLIGEGRHERFIVNREKFQQKANAKIQAKA